MNTEMRNDLSLHHSGPKGNFIEEMDGGCTVIGARAWSLGFGVWGIKMGPNWAEHGIPILTSHNISAPHSRMHAWCCVIAAWQIHHLSKGIWWEYFVETIGSRMKGHRYLYQSARRLKASKAKEVVSRNRKIGDQIVQRWQQLKKFHDTWIEDQSGSLELTLATPNLVSLHDYLHVCTVFMSAR